MRPVDTWKSTEALPTPTSVGPWLVPSPLSPWQEAHPAEENNARPAATSALLPPSAATWVVGDTAA